MPVPHGPLCVLLASAELLEPRVLILARRVAERRLWLAMVVGGWVGAYTQTVIVPDPARSNSL